MESDKPFVKSPAFQMYPADFLSDKNTLVMPTVEIGAYCLLLFVCWDEGGLPDSMEDLAGIARLPVKQFQPMWERHIERCFQKREDGRWSHKRLEKEREKQAINRAKRQAAGVEGGKAKWSSNGNGNDYSRPRSQRLAEARAKGRHTEDEWQEMLTYFGACLRCGDQESIVKDHVIPIYQGGSDAISNIQPLCRKCNSGKGADNSDLRIGKVPDERLAEFWQVPFETPDKRLPINSLSDFSLQSSSSDQEQQRAKRTPDAKGARLPENFSVTLELRAWAKSEAPHVDLDKALVEFHDYWKAVPGAKGRKLDWPATFRNRVRELEGRKNGSSARLAPEHPNAHRSGKIIV